MQLFLNMKSNALKSEVLYIRLQMTTMRRRKQKLQLENEKVAMNYFVKLIKSDGTPTIEFVIKEPQILSSEHTAYYRSKSLSIYYTH